MMGENDVPDVARETGEPTMSPQDSAPPIVRRLSSYGDGSYRGPLLYSPIWYAVLAASLGTMPGYMSLSIMTNWQKHQLGDSAYWITNIQSVLQALLLIPTLALCGYLSQPHRLGRKTMLISLSVLGVMLASVPLLTENIYYNLLLQVAFACIGVDRGCAGVTVVLFAWITDWCRPEDKVAYFAIFLGGLSGVLSVASIVPIWIGEEHKILWLIFVVAGVNFIFIAGSFPGELPDLGAFSPRRLSQAYDISPVSSPSSPLAPNKPWRHILKSIGFLFRQHTSETIIYILLNMTDAAVENSIALFLEKERSFTGNDLYTLLTAIALSSFFLQTVMVPILHKLGIASEQMLVLGLGSMVVHFTVYAFVHDKLVIILLEPFGACGYVASTAATALISGTLSGRDMPRDQGTLLGTLNSLQKVAKCIGPTLIAVVLTQYKNFPAPFNFAGVSFALLAVVMLFALVASLKLCCSRSGRKSASLDLAVSLH